MTPRELEVLELMKLGRTNREFAAALEPVVATHREALRREARLLFPEAAERNPDFDAFIDMVFSSMQGRALGSLASLDPRSDVNELVTLYRIARRELSDPDG